MDKQQLEQRVFEIQAEQSANVWKIAQHNAEVARLQAAIFDAQRRYDTKGDDNARDEIAAYREQVAATEALRKQAQTQLAEYPGRITAVKAEIEAISYREKLRELATLKDAELSAFEDAAAAMLESLSKWNAFIMARSTRRAMGTHCEQTSRVLGLPTPDAGGFNYPVPNDAWFVPGSFNQVCNQFDKALVDARKKAG